MNPKIEKLFALPLYQRILILVVLCGLIIGGFIYFLFLPNIERLERLNKQNQTLANQLLEDRRIANNLPKFKAEYEKMQQRLNAALAELPNDKEIPTLLTNIAAVANDNGLEIMSFKPGKETPKGFYAEVPVALEMMGTYHQIAKFSYDIGQLSRIVNLQNLNLTKGSSRESGSSAGELLKIKCSAITFRFLEKQAAPPKKGKRKR